MAPSSLIFFNIFSLLILLLSSIIMADARVNKTEMINQFLDAHNTARKAVGVPPLKWEPLLANFAHAYSNQRRHDCALVHSTAMAYGENIFIGQGRLWSANDAVAAWVAEKQFYDYSSNACSGPDCTHYTQIVWRTTEQVGCAKIICDNGSSYITCEYYPPGNYVGARPY
ncbi:pathogenesis-related protein PR-1 type-like protein [Cinnamomum micranthum f. kanehirae]|uniref:Pathogenesis-related protein PR-1 type-like protein n=1 Tax=Cinnamomum micranthum f. kanehirae TaxID=337451 RepID=A0A3S3QCT7_9MAGN|nr:pathogenesis-related protein PR-1 type-like protein [Cinnamomum micranthum f. kanehirae]